MAFPKPVPRSNNLVRKLTRFCIPSIIYIITGISLYLLSIAYGADIPYVFTGFIFISLIGVINLLCSNGYKAVSWILALAPVLTFIASALTGRVPALYQSLYDAQGSIMPSAQGVGQAALSGGMDIGQAALGGAQGMGQAGLNAGVGMGQAALSGGMGMGQAGLNAGMGMGQAGLGAVQGAGQAVMGMPTMGQTMGMGMGSPSMGMPSV